MLIVKLCKTEIWIDHTNSGIVQLEKELFLFDFGSKLKHVGPDNCLVVYL